MWGPWSPSEEPHFLHGRNWPVADCKRMEVIQLISRSILLGNSIRNDQQEVDKKLPKQQVCHLLLNP